MKRFIFFLAFVVVASVAAAQNPEGLGSPYSAAAFTPTHGIAPGTRLPTEPLSTQAMPYVLVFSLLSPLRAAEAVVLGVTSVSLINSMSSGNNDYDGSSKNTTPPSLHHPSFRGRSSARHGYIFRRY